MRSNQPFLPTIGLGSLLFLEHPMSLSHITVNLRNHAQHVQQYRSSSWQRLNLRILQDPVSSPRKKLGAGDDWHQSVCMCRTCHRGSVVAFNNLEGGRETKVTCPSLYLPEVVFSLRSIQKEKAKEYTSQTCHQPLCTLNECALSIQPYITLAFKFGFIYD